MSIEIDINSKEKKPVIMVPKLKREFSLFKKKPKIPLTEEQQKKRKIIRKYLILAIFSFLVGFYGYKAFRFSDIIGIKIKPQDIFNPIKKDPELKRDSSKKYTAVLLVGIDTRNERSSLRNTDTIMIGVYDYETADTTLISVPRDLYVEVPGEGWYSKVNGIYAVGEDKEKGKGLQYLEATLEDITGIEIQYYAMIDLLGFKSIINTVGGVTVNVQNSFTDYQFPTEDPSKSMYEVLSFEKGPQEMDGELALKYARSRHSPDNNEGSDFARARRQQNVVIALKDKVLSSETLLNPSKVLGIIEAIQSNLRLSEFTLEEIQAGINLISKQKDKTSNIYSFVLDPSIGNYTVLTDKDTNIGNLYVIIPKLGFGNNDGIKDLISKILDNPAIYAEKAVIMVYDSGLGYYPTLEKVNLLKEQFPYLNIRYMGTLYYDKEDTIVYKNQETGAANTAKAISTHLKTENVTKPDYIVNGLNGEDITILFGKEVVKEKIGEVIDNTK